MRRSLAAAFLFLFGLNSYGMKEASAGSGFYHSEAGLQFEVPSGSYVVEREIFSDSHPESLSTVRIIKILPQGVSEESSLGGLARVQVEVFEPAPWADLNQWASSVRDRSFLKTRDQWIKVGGQDALSLEILSETGQVGSREIFLIRKNQGILISSRELPLLEALLKTIRFREPRELRQQDFRGGEGEAAQDTSRAGEPRVRMIYLVPSDRVPDEGYRKGMERAIRELQGFYQRELGGKTFALHSPVVEVVRTQHPVAWYTTNAPASSSAGRFWESVVAEGFAVDQGRFDDPSNRWIFYIDADPLCGQYVGGTSGVALLPPNDLRGLTCQQNIPVCGGSPDNAGLCRWVGGLGHELGHSFNLPHPTVGTCPGSDPGCDYALMWLGYITFPNAYLLPADKKSLLKSPSTKKFFKARPLVPAELCTTGCAGGAGGGS